ncbi:hypothetical protein [Litorihabitans aurantiacus]|uniref:HK97 gp10 family phage protein n=1 Tax=Litorihabitans aurantiacus TaxID=1930061 RepID=A0AA37XI47_9MICO|nr:hypothetical protein [Litorihabitans aurantiacus]GMA33509.1 hypothetical protein GCM10025875_35010 [Litorihabitans aurantiacus]GMA33586.1 hypothetical protein GCM10025875_35780 [Litorihabitans aurantiacus]
MARFPDHFAVLAERRPALKFLIPILSVVEKAAQEGMTEAGETILARSNDRAPVDSGDLRAAGFVDTADLAVKVGYEPTGGYPYFRRQHEDLDYQHDTGEAKFLEKAEAETRDEVPAIIARHIKGALGG